MRNRDLFNKKLEQVEVTLLRLKKMAKQGAPIQDFIGELEIGGAIVDDLKGMVEIQNLDKYEMNNLR